MSELLRKLQAEQVQVLLLVLVLVLAVPHTLHVDRLFELTTVHALHRHVAGVATVAAVVQFDTAVGLGAEHTAQLLDEVVFARQVINKL